LKSVAIHKAVALGSVPLDPFRVNDMDLVFAHFPELNIEIVHGGYAFLEETALHVYRFPNCLINLEGTANFLNRQPRKFAQILGTFLMWGAEDRLIWASGCDIFHPRPLLEAFWDLEMPRDLVEDEGFPPLTKQVKRKKLGENAARANGFNLLEMTASSKHDRFSSGKRSAGPWGRAGLS